MKSELAIKNFKNKWIDIDKKKSREILNLIIKNKRIDYNKLNLGQFKEEVFKLQQLFFSYKLKFNREYIRNKPRYFIFWIILKEHYNIIDFDLIKKKKENISEKSRCKSNVVYTCITKIFGFNPSLLSICFNASHIKEVLKSNQNLFLEKLTPNFHTFEKNEKKVFFNAIKKKKIQIISPICPDYEYKKIGKNIFSFTFNALNEGIGLPGERIVNEVSEIYKFLKKNNVEFVHNIYYGDFESFSKKNCERLKISKQVFLKKLSKSVEKLKNKELFDKIGFFVKDLSNIDEWNELMEKNRSHINNKFKSDALFKKKIREIFNARKNLYSNWFPNRKDNFYIDVLLEQGAEYATMTEIILRKFSNPLIIAADHPKMKFFYNLNKNIGLAYLKKAY